jgi:hypothetical protein
MQNKIANIWYPSKLWLLTIVVPTPILYLITNSVIYSDIIPQLIFFSLLFALFMSLPVYIVCHLTYLALIKSNLPSLLIKAVIDLLCIVGIFITFRIISGEILNSASWYYSASVIVFSIFLKVYKRDKTTPTFTDSNNEQDI